MAELKSGLVGRRKGRERCKSSYVPECEDSEGSVCLEAVQIIHELSEAGLVTPHQPLLHEGGEGIGTDPCREEPAVHRVVVSPQSAHEEADSHDEEEDRDEEVHELDEESEGPGGDHVGKVDTHDAQYHLVLEEHLIPRHTQFLNASYVSTKMYYKA